MPKNNVVVELFYNGVWNDITLEEEVFTENPITIIQGQSDETGSLRPCQVTMKLNNANDKYRISNPLSPLYRLVGRNTPIRVSVGTNIRVVAEINSWQCDESRDFRKTPRRGKAWTDITASGILYRVNRWKRFIRSTLYRSITLSGYDIAEYWDMEVPSGGFEAPSVVGGSSMVPVTATRFTLADGSVLPPGGVPDFAKGNRILGSAPLPSFQSGGTLTAPVRTTTFDGYAIDWVMQFEANTDGGGTSSCDVLNWTESGTYVTFSVNVTKGFVTVFHSNAADAATLSATGSATATFDMYDGSPHHFRYQVRQSGGSYLAQLYIDSSVYATADNFVPGMAGTVGVPKVIQWNPLEDRGDYMPVACGHLTIWPSGQIGDQPPVFSYINGKTKEKTDSRLSRLLSEENISFATYGTPLDTYEMGAQKPDTLFNHIQEIKTTEDGIVCDDNDSIGIRLKLRTDRYNQTPVMTLYPTDFAKLPVEVTDDLDTHNIVTVTQRDGGQASAEDSTGFLGTQDPPLGVGEAKFDVEVNLHNPTYETLVQYANWWMKRGTVDVPRFPQVTLDLNASPHLISDVEFMRPGDVIEIANLREFTIRLFVLGWTEIIGTHARTITLVCKPDEQFVVGEYDSTTSRYDLATSTLDGVHSINATTLTFSMTADESWSLTSRYELMISGEMVTIPIGGMAARTGVGPYSQVATGVVRGVNGINKVLPDNSEVHVATPGRWAL